MTTLRDILIDYTEELLKLVADLPDGEELSQDDKDDLIEEYIDTVKYSLIG